MNTFLETIIFFYVIRHQNLTEIFKSSFFNTKQIQYLFDIVKPFVLEYKATPTEVQTNDLIKVSGKEEILTPDAVHTIWQSESKVSEYTEDWLYQNTVSFAEWQNLMISLRRVLTYVKSIQTEVTFENCKEIVEKAKTIFSSNANFTINQSKGHDFFDPMNHQSILLDTKTSGYNFIDLCLDGGFSKKALVVLMGPPKAGKSNWLCNLAGKSVVSGNNTIYITLEMSYQLVNQRIGSNLLKIPIEEYKESAKDQNFMTKKMNDFFNANIMQKPGKFIVEEFPTSSASVLDIESFILKKEEEFSTEDKPFKFDNIFIDYINIMKDSKNPNSDNLYIKIKNICEDVRAMAQRNNWSVISATQTNRSGFDNADMNMSNVSESSGLIATADALFGIIQTTSMRAEGIYYLKAVAIRNTGHMGDKKKFKLDKRYLKIEEDKSESIIQDGIEIPKVHNSFNAQSQQPAQNIPQLGISESQINVNDLFK